MDDNNEVCSTCGLPYEDRSIRSLVCSNPFHLCKNCKYLDGETVELCLSCKTVIDVYDDWESNGR